MTSFNMKVVIPALKKNVAFQDELIKKLSGITLIQRAINKASQLGIENKHIYLLTDSEEIQAIGKRNEINIYYDSDLVWGEINYASKIWNYLQNMLDKTDYMLFLSPYTPLLSVNTINTALKELIKSNKFALKPIRKVKRQLYDGVNQSVFEALFGDKKETHKIESKSFMLIKKNYFQHGFQDKVSILEWPIGNEIFEIDSYQDWWVCEKLLNRKRIIFRVIGNQIVGLGHVYRSLSLAHEITDHEILFVCDNKSNLAVKKLTECDYWLGVYDSSTIVDGIINLSPNLVINDILSSNEKDVLPLKKLGIKTLNFEDLGEGAKLSDLTINELYDKPLYSSKNSLWGYQYFFVRDEFNDARPHSFEGNVKKIMLSFGGTDQHNLSYKVYKVIKNICAFRKIHINIVTGPGYKEYQVLEKKIKGTPGVSLTQATGVISNIMEHCQIAIVSNGRTVYELAHMNIPSIVISQHEREALHSFASKKNGFLHIGLFKEESFKTLIEKNLLNLIDNEDFRHQLFLKTMKYSFRSNKQKVLNRIEKLLTGNEE